MGSEQAGSSRRRPVAWELRASVTEKTFSTYDRAARALGRSRSWHVGLVVEAFGQVLAQLTERERTRLDEALRNPEQLLELLRSGMR